MNFLPTTQWGRGVGFGRGETFSQWTWRCEWKLREWELIGTEHAEAFSVEVVQPAAAENESLLLFCQSETLKFSQQRRNPQILTVFKQIQIIQFLWGQRLTFLLWRSKMSQQKANEPPPPLLRNTLYFCFPPAHLDKHIDPVYVCCVFFVSPRPPKLLFSKKKKLQGCETQKDTTCFWSGDKKRNALLIK